MKELILIMQMRKILLIPLLFLFLAFPVRAAYINSCSVLGTTGETYYLTADIINSSASKCMDIQANNIILDCQGHLIDGVDAGSSYGIYIVRSYPTTTNIVIRNCVITDWCYGIYFYYTKSNNITNTTADSNSQGITFEYSASNTVSNVTVSNSYFGINLLYSSSNSNTIKDSVFRDNSYGIRLFQGSYSNIIYNNLLNNSVNAQFDGTVGINYWNTTRQTGSRIYSPGTEIGGNYWTNPSDTGYSDTCTDANRDGFCDNPYVLNTNNTDYLPLSGTYCGCTEWVAGYCYNYTHRTYTRNCMPSGCDVEVKYEEDSTCSPYCNCTDWVAGECVSSTQRKYTRICIPYGCNVEVKYENDPTCAPITEYPWLSLVNIMLSPFWIIMAMVFGMSAAIEKKLQTGGIAFLAALLIFLFIFAFFTRSIPLWIPIIFLIMAVGYMIFRGRA
jgi:parallel beta-helix repeat protein